MIHQGDCLEVLRTLPSESVHCCVTSPPYWGLRDYGCDGQLGLEKSPEEYVSKMTDVFREVRRVLRNDGTLWLNIGDSYAGGGGFYPNAPSNLNFGSLSSKQNDGSNAKPKGIKPQGTIKTKDLVGIPWRLAFALQSDGWYLRQDIIWHKPNPMPESVRDRCTKAHEYVFLMSKSARYWWDAGAVSEEAQTAGKIGGFTGYQATAMNVSPSGNQIPENGRKYIRPDTRNRRSVWTVATQPCKEAHFAVMPQKLVEPCILAGCPEDCTVLDPFFGAGTVGLVASKLGRKFIGIELNPEYIAIANARINAVADKMPLLEPAK